MKFNLLLALFAFCLLILVASASDDENCNFTVEKLNNQILILDKNSQTCGTCILSNAKMTIQSDEKQITSITLTAVEDSSPIKSTVLQPKTQSLIINPQFKVQYQNGNVIQTTNFMTSCKTKTVNQGQLLYNLVFSVKVNGNDQDFELNNGYTSSRLLKNLSYLAIILFMMLFY